MFIAVMIAMFIAAMIAMFIAVIVVGVSPYLQATNFVTPTAVGGEQTRRGADR
jgi:hypothetical protein